MAQPRVVDRRPYGRIMEFEHRGNVLLIPSTPSSTDNNNTLSPDTSPPIKAFQISSHFIARTSTSTGLLAFVTNNPTAKKIIELQVNASAIVLEHILRGLYTHYPPPEPSHNIVHRASSTLLRTILSTRSLTRLSPIPIHEIELQTLLSLLQFAENYGFTDSVRCIVPTWIGNGYDTCEPRDVIGYLRIAWYLQLPEVYKSVTKRLIKEAIYMPYRDGRSIDEKDVWKILKRDAPNVKWELFVRTHEFGDPAATVHVKLGFLPVDVQNQILSSSQSLTNTLKSSALPLTKVATLADYDNHQLQKLAFLERRFLPTLRNFISTAHLRLAVLPRHHLGKHKVSQEKLHPYHIHAAVEMFMYCTPIELADAARQAEKKMNMLDMAAKMDQQYKQCFRLLEEIREAMEEVEGLELPGSL